MTLIHYIEGVAGSGKSSFLLDVMEQKLSEGVRPHQIGFVTFSRAAAREAAERAAKLTGVHVEVLTGTGWFRTLHSCALRCLGIPGSVILDPDSAKGREWFREHCGAERGTSDAAADESTTHGRRTGRHEDTYAGQLGAALNKWDLFRSQASLDSLQNRNEQACCTPDKLQTGVTEVSSSSFGGNDQKTAEQDSVQYSGLYTSELGFPGDCPKTQPVENKELRSTEKLSWTVVDTRGQSEIARLSSRLTNEKAGPEAVHYHSYTPIGKNLFGLSNCDCPDYTLLKSENDCPETVYDGLSGKNTGKNLDSHDCPTSVRECPDCPDTTTRTGTGTTTSSEAPYTRIGSSEDRQKFTSVEMDMIRQYEFAKRTDQKLDFTDILLKFAGIRFDEDLRPVQAYPEGSVPQEIQVWFVDEAQDNSPLLDDVVRRLTEQADEVQIAGDPHQAVYGFAGSDPMRFLDWKFMSDKRTLLRRSWRNPECVVEWAENVLMTKDWYQTREPFSEFDGGSVGLAVYGDFMRWLKEMPTAQKDSLIIARAWFLLQPIKRFLDEHSIPWASCNEKAPSRWQAPAKIAYTLVMRDLAAGRKISQQDFRRIIDTLNQKHDQKELFRRGEKARWKKLECSQNPEYTLNQLKDWGTTPYFEEFVEKGLWLFDAPLLINYAIEKYGVDNVRNPKIRIGTVHSVKGLQAHHVFCLASSTERCNEKSDEDINLKYVAITRAEAHYRLVVDPNKAATGKPLFWAAPRSATTYDRKSPLERSNAASTISPLDQITDECLGHEISGRNPRNQRHTGPDTLHQRSLPDHRTQSAGEQSNQNTEVPDAADQECWWNF